jgi:hypothetical protein
MSQRVDGHKMKKYVYYTMISYTVTILVLIPDPDVANRLIWALTPLATVLLLQRLHGTK